MAPAPDLPRSAYQFVAIDWTDDFTHRDLAPYLWQTGEIECIYPGECPFLFGPAPFPVLPGQHEHAYVSEGRLYPTDSMYHALLSHVGPYRAPTYTEFMQNRPARPSDFSSTYSPSDMHNPYGRPVPPSSRQELVWSWSDHWHEGRAHLMRSHLREFDLWRLSRWLLRIDHWLHENNSYVATRLQVTGARALLDHIFPLIANIDREAVVELANGLGRGVEPEAQIATCSICGETTLHGKPGDEFETTCYTTAMATKLHCSCPQFLPSDLCWGLPKPVWTAYGDLTDAYDAIRQRL